MSEEYNEGGDDVGYVDDGSTTIGSSGKQEEFSHTRLVMSALRKCQEAGAQEKRAGWVQSKIDRMGNSNIVKVYPDTRKEFISCVKTALLIMRADFTQTDEYKKPAEDVWKRIQDLSKSIDEKEKEVLINEKFAWGNMIKARFDSLTKSGIYQITGKIALPELREEMINFQDDVYGEILAELHTLIKEIGFYAETEYTA